MRSRIDRARDCRPARECALAAFLIFAALGCLAGPKELWPADAPKLDAEQLRQVIAKVDATGKSMAPVLTPAIDYEKAFLRILSGAAGAEWKNELDRLAAPSAQDAVSAGVANLAKAWLARLEMEKIGDVLRAYYRQNVHFPATLAEVEKDLPPDLKRDPWGDPWIYKPKKPEGFSGMEGQRYQLAPTRLPDLIGLDEATSRREPVSIDWKVIPRDAAGGAALEFQPLKPGSAVAIIQPGGAVGDCTLLFLGDHWALLARVDQLFAVAF